jgi:5-methylthioadenosine/S-adenosylhomocysteine deaminase
MSERTLISDAVMVNPSLPPEVVRDGWLFMEDGTIRAMGVGAPPSTWRERAHEHVRAAGGILLPGLVNTHNHAAMALFRGLADDLPLKAWLEGTIFPAEARVVDEDFVYWGTLLACAEMIRNGTTTFADGYFFEDQALDAARRAGMRAILAAGVVDLPTPDCPDPVLNVERAIAFVNRARACPRADTLRADRLSARDEDRLRPGIFCHAPYTCTPQTLQKAKEACRVHQIPYFIHASETRWEVEEIENRFGTSPVRHLDRLGLLDRDTILIHGIWVDEEEIQILAKRGCGVAICTESNMKLASGVAPLPAYLANGVHLGLGTDGPASNNDLDLFGEMDRTAKLHKVHWGDPTVPDAATVLHMATLGGARLLGWEHLGLLKPGYQADLILLRVDRPHLQPLHNPVSQLVYAANGADVDTVWIQGKTVMRARELLTIDEEEIYENVERIKRKIES